MFRITESNSVKGAVVVAFRGSSKSTIMTLSYPLWAIMGKQQKKFVVIFTQTQQQARLIMANLRKELETNELLKKEMGPFSDQSGEWSAFSIVLPKFNARIMVASADQSIRGMRHGAYRPDLIVCDDVEDLGSVKTREARDRTFRWFVSEVIPAGDRDTKIVVIGNLLHEDSLLMRLKENIEKRKWDGIYKAFPIVDYEGRILWPGKFKSMEDIERLKLSVPNENAWQREYMLRIVPEEDQLIFPEWLHHYDSLPAESPRYVATAVDLAISEKDTADYTAIVSAYIYGCGENLRIYILPNPVNERMGFPETVERIESIHSAFASAGLSSRVYVEKVGYQESVVQQLAVNGVRAEGISPHGSDKRSRLALTTNLIQTGKIIFPRFGAERLIEQLVGFGKEKHDDLADAFSMLALTTVEKNRFEGGFLVTKR
ncbi:MAG: phage terminase large subunit [Candidatus Moranbacteria bacterium]|nr:phage terminase large subunit [Candidatus Moranbacteria bacterium]